MNKELIQIGKQIRADKSQIKEKTETQTPQPQPEEKVPEKKIPETEVKDQYDAKDEIYYETEKDGNNIAIFVSYNDDENLVNLEPTQGGNVFAVNKDNIIGAVVKKEKVKSKAEDAVQNLAQESLHNILPFKKFKFL